MGKSGWAAATGLGSLVLLLAACGGSGSNTVAGSASSAAQASSGSSGPAAPASSATAAATATKGGGSTPTTSATSRQSAAPQPSSGADHSIPPVGTTVMVVQKSAIGYVLAEANHQVVYTYSKDKKNGPPTCTGTCAATWLPVTGMPQAGPADHFPGTFGLVKTASGVQQITYNGYPLYTLKGAKALRTTGNGMGGVWHVVPLSASDVSA